MTDMPPALFDRDLLALRRGRVRSKDALFLHEQGADLVQERLLDVNRRFTDICFVGWQGQFWAEMLGLDARVIADTETLDLEPESCDLIVHCLCLHWANDPVGQLIQMRRALRPDGLMIAVLFSGDTLHELRHALTQAEAEVLGGIRPHIAPMADLRGLGALLQRAGFALPVADNLRLDVSYGDVLGLMRDLRAMGETNILADRGPGYLRKDVMARMSEVYHRDNADGDRLKATFELAFLTGWAPADSQQKPLRPGSAQSRLADALGVPEFSETGKKT